MWRAARALSQADGGCTMHINRATADEEHAAAKKLADMAETYKGWTKYGLHGYVMALDGLVFRIPAPPAHLRERYTSEFYNTHYGCWGLTILVLCDLRGRIVHITRPVAVQEQSISNRMGLRKLLQWVKVQTTTKLGVLTDGLYTLSPITLPKNEQVPHMFTLAHAGLELLHKLHDTMPEYRDDAKQALWTAAAVSQLRVVVENVNAQLRGYQVLGSGRIFRGKFWKWARKSGYVKGHRQKTYYMPLPEHIVAAVSWLVSLRMVRTNTFPRAEDWRPTPSKAMGDIPDDFQVGYPLFGGDTRLSNAGSLTGRVRRLLIDHKTALKAAKVAQSKAAQAKQHF